MKLLMSANFNAPGETRTPNLLIRSQPHPSYLGLRRSVLEWERAPESDVETPKGDETSHNISRIAHLRSLIRHAQDCYDSELHQLESLNVVHADPALTAAHGEPVV